MWGMALVEVLFLGGVFAVLLLIFSLRNTYRSF